MIYDCLRFLFSIDYSCIANGHSLIMTSTSTILSGYGPRTRIYFNGDPESFTVWETRFTNYLYTVDKGVYDAITGNEEGDDFAEKNRKAYAELVQVLDERSLQLIISDTANNGREAFKVLKNHYAQESLHYMRN